jgi:hypothetical protein
MGERLKPAEAMGRAAFLFGSGDLDEAERVCRSILRMDPRHFYAVHLLATLALRRGDAQECVRIATRALQIDPRHVEVLCNRGAALRMLNRLDEAIADYDRALAVAPDSAEALNNRGVALAALNRHDEALASYSRALEVKPDYGRARFNRGLSRLVLGDYESGWPDHEWRWTGSDTQMPRRTFAAPQWTGREDLHGKTILLHAEQGIGDSIMFSRYARLVRERGATVVLEVHPPLKALLSSMEGADQVLALGEPLPDVDFHIPLMSLPLAFGTRFETIPAPIAYLTAPPEHVERWRARLADRPGPRIGIAWSGSTTLKNDLNRSIPLAALAPLRRAAVTLVSLQKEIRDYDRPALAEGPSMLTFEDEIADFRDTAALASLMDLVISVDTSVAHLAGALGRPLWLLLPYSPDWRWRLGREDTPWYPQARIFRQPALADWASVITRLACEIPK